jgi:hypothetical protein
MGEPAAFTSCWPGWSVGQSAEQTADGRGAGADAGIGVRLESNVRRIEPGRQLFGWGPTPMASPAHDSLGPASKRSPHRHART